MFRKIVIIGATSSIAEHCARNWVATESVDLILVGRDLQRVERVAADLRVRSPTSRIRSVKANFSTPDAIFDTVHALVTESVPDIVLIAHGSLPDQKACQHNLQLVNEALGINGISSVLFAEAFATSMEEVGHGTIAIIGSVAGDRGRKTNYIYGAAKGLVARYAEGLQHRLAAKGVIVVLIKPGPTDTPMTADLKSRGARLASVEKVAKKVVEGIHSGRSTIYVPGKWRWIMLVIRNLPAFVFNKLNI
ncbi:SDR family NAD(P)-dependent oxidoreductase [Variovorax sp.]|jgi:decaprenylphospho-beta-D-erythro-pentofuranosid-2-ulose 2-reductase|uniref:SDR family NAD(P)-dependent oxidoreductase n=1 Tax=Variovorax sp. TaxID=1871043 RepID=UPI001207B45B|nr:SDR family NAD(P)-dependent oxidoreductase [Variovorax sp.]TAJ68055.1 MAG: SDR family NAD(P)-dependent oxidoreductase [Variovorax sp.]